MKGFDRKLSFTILLCWNIIFVQGSEQCVMHDVCGNNPKTNKNLYCQYNGPPKPLKNELALNILTDLCPSFDLGPNNSTCCSEKVLLVLQENMKVIQNSFGQCPSCYQNLVTIFCNAMCSRNQSDFLMVTKAVQPIFYHGNPYFTSVAEVSYYIHEDFARGLYNSCKDVRLSYTNQTVMESICGTSKCSPYNFLKYFATGNMLQVQLNFQFERFNNISVNGNTFYPMNDAFYKCDEAPKGKDLCSYLDCPSSPPSYQSQKRLPLQNSPVFIASWILYLALLAIISIYFMKTVRKDSENDDDYRPSLTHRRESMPDIHSYPILFGNSSYQFLQLFFYKFANIFSTPKGYAAIYALFLTFLFISCGFLQYYSDNNYPTYLWSSTKSLLQKEKNYFNEHFGPLKRKVQIIVTPKNNTTNNLAYSKVFDRQFLRRVLDLQFNITELVVLGDNREFISFEDACYFQNGQCVIESVLNWFQNKASHLDYYNERDYMEYLRNCTKNPLFMQKTGLSCLGDFGGPIYPYLVLGGTSNKTYENASALIISFLLKNDNMSYVITWEKRFLEYMNKYNDPNMKISFYSEQLANNYDMAKVFTVNCVVLNIFVISLAIFVYGLNTQMSIFLLIGLGILFTSFVTSLGLFCIINVPMNIFSVYSFTHFIFYMGMGNVFFLIHLLYKYPKLENEKATEYIVRLLNQAFLSLLLVTLSQIISLIIAGIFLDSPVTAISCYVGVLGLTIFFIMTIQMFCIKFFIAKPNATATKCCDFTILEAASRNSKFFTKILDYEEKVFEYVIYFLMNTKIRLFVAFIFVNTFSLSVMATYQIEIGLDQKLTMPENSHMLQFYTDFEQYSFVGPPVYFVVPSPFNYTDIKNQNALCNFPYCSRDSLVAQISRAAKQSHVTYIAEPPLDWIDGYFTWANDGINCCRVHYYDSTKFCPFRKHASNVCKPCNIVNPETYRPYPEQFYPFFEHFLEENPSELCPSFGHYVFDNSVEMIKDKVPIVGATYFLSYHTNLKTSSDHINAQKFAREIAKNISHTFKLHNVSNGDVSVFPYSPDYIFYERHLSMWNTTVIALPVTIAVIFAVTLILTGFSFHYAIFLVINIIIVIVQIFGVMYLWNIPLNEFSLVNLIIATSISVEYCVHVTNAFASSLRLRRTDRVCDAFLHTGIFVFYSFLYKFVGIIALHYTVIPLFSVIIYRLYWAINIVNFLHTFFFLPVLLSIFGPSCKRSNVTDLIINEDNPSPTMECDSIS